jgi:hypothetical protein
VADGQRWLHAQRAIVDGDILSTCTRPPAVKACLGRSGGRSIGWGEPEWESACSKCRPFAKDRLGRLHVGEQLSQIGTV